MKKLILPLIAALLVGCTNELPEKSMSEADSLESIKNYELLIDSKSQTLDCSDASKVAMLFQSRDNRTISRADYFFTTPQVETVYDSEFIYELWWICGWI